MKLTIVAAAGGIGRQLLEQALAAGHDVTAVVRRPDKLAKSQARIVTADLAAPNPGTPESAVKGGRRSILWPWPPNRAPKPPSPGRGTRAIVSAMEAVGVRRIVAVSAAPIGTVPSPALPRPPKNDPGDGLFMRYLISPILKAALRTRYADLARMEDVLRASGREWTIVRPAALNDKPLTGSYRVAYGQNLRRGLQTSRADVAHFMLRALERRDTITQVIGIAT